jgi:hypothetical protein
MARRRRVDRFSRELRERKYRLRARTTRFIPDSDSDFARMARQFANHAAAHAERFRIPAEQAEQMSRAVEQFRQSLAKTIWPDTAGPRATRTKNDARAEAERVIRAAALTIRACGSLDAVDRLHLNLAERPKRVKPRECPPVAPVLTFVGGTHGNGGIASGPAPRHILEYGNDFDYGSSAKPHGAARLELFVELVPVNGPMPALPGDLSGGRLWYVRSYTTSRFEVEYPVMADGTPMLVVYWGRWADARGGVGPFSQPCVARVEGGALPELVYRGVDQPRRALPGAGVTRKVEHREFAMLGGAAEVKWHDVRQLEGPRPHARMLEAG